MSLFTDDFEEASIDDLFAEFGESVVYTHRNGGTPRTITAIPFSPTNGTRVNNQTAHRVTTNSYAYAFRNNELTGVSDPGTGDRLTVNGVVWEWAETLEQSTSITAIQWHRATVKPGLQANRL